MDRESWLSRPLPMQRLILMPLAAVGLLVLLLARDRSLKVVDRSVVAATVVSVEPARTGAPAAARRAFLLTARLDDGQKVVVVVSGAAAPDPGEKVALIRERLRDGSTRYGLNTAASMGEAAPLPTP